eukprot:GFUD01032719.1.p1 GENE.GFUD01032719.1~~GFUD01032719.1.p1  ORF type:complete len:256 (-),score=55.03 GFUD01032719.1:141-908(-)
MDRIKIISEMRIFSSENVFHCLKGSFGFLISVVLVFLGLTNKCSLQPQLPFWAFGTSGFLFLANSASLMFNNVSAVQSWQKNIKKEHRTIGRFLDHVHGFFYSTFLIWVIPGLQWTYSSRQKFEHNYKSCDSSVQNLSLLLLFVLFLEVVLHFILFGYNLYKQLSERKANKLVSSKPEEIKKTSKVDDEELTKNKSEGKETSTKRNLDNEASKLAKAHDNPQRASTSRRNIEKGKVSNLSRAFESGEGDIMTTKM